MPAMPVPASAADAALEELAARAAGLHAASGGDLLGCFALVPDPRARRGTRHSLAAILAMCTAAVLSGCGSLEDVTAWVSAADQGVLAALGCRRNALGVLTPPHPDTIVRVLAGLGAQHLADHAGACLARRVLHGPAVFPVAGPGWLPAIAVDGKAVRGAAGPDGLIPYLLAAAMHRDCAVIAERLIGPKTNEVPEFAPLLRGLNERVSLAGHVITMDAGHTVRAHATLACEELLAHYVMTVEHASHCSCWETALQAASGAEAELDRRQSTRPVQLSTAERARVLALGTDLRALWTTSATTDRDRKELLRTLLDDVVVTVDHGNRTARLVMHWKGGLISETSAGLPRPRPPYRTSEETVSLIGRLAAHYDDTMITKVLNQQQRRTATGLSFTPANVATIRKRHNIPASHGGTAQDQDGEVMTVHQAAASLGITPSTLYRWLSDGFVPGEQITPGAPGGSGSPAPPARSSPTTHQPAGYPCRSPLRPSACPARPCCSVSSAASSAPPTSVPDAGKACVSSCQYPRTACSSRPRQSRSSVMTNRLGPRCHV
jgi:hypothetical protein